MIDQKTAPYAALALRLALGVMFIAHALLKIFVFTLPGAAGFFASQGFPGWSVYPVTGLEIIGGAMLILGVYSRWVAVAVLPLLLGVISVHAGNGWVFNAPNGGWEYPAFLIVSAFALLLLGDGALALSPAIKRR